MKESKGKYSGRMTWVIICAWTLLITWTIYATLEHLHWNGLLWIVLIITYVIVLFPIIAYSNWCEEGVE